MAQADLKLPGADAHRARRLDIRIPAVDRQFIVKDGRDDFKIGTEVELLAVAGKTRVAAGGNEAGDDEDGAESQGQADGFQRSLKVTEYLCQIAGFVEFPIHVTETWPDQTAPRQTLILHPDRDREAELEEFGPGTEAHQLGRDYPWERVTAPESLNAAREHMRVLHYELKDLPGAEGYEGWVGYPAPRADVLDVRTERHESEGLAREVILGRTGGRQEQSTAVWFSTSLYDADPTLVRVYRDGILLPRLLSAPCLDGGVTRRRHGGSPLPPPYLAINLPSAGTPGTNAARTGLADRQAQWDLPIWTAILVRVAETEVREALSLAPAERLLRIGWLAQVLHLREREILGMVPREKRVRVWLVAPGRWDYREGPVPDAPISVLPGSFYDLFQDPPWRPYGAASPDTAVTWQGPDSLVSGLIRSKKQHGRGGRVLFLGLDRSGTGPAPISCPAQGPRHPAGPVGGVCPRPARGRAPGLDRAEDQSTRRDPCGTRSCCAGPRATHAGPTGPCRGNDRGDAGTLRETVRGVSMGLAAVL